MYVYIYIYIYIYTHHTRNHAPGREPRQLDVCQPAGPRRGVRRAAAKFGRGDDTVGNPDRATGGRVGPREA